MKAILDKQEADCIRFLAHEFQEGRISCKSEVLLQKLGIEDKNLFRPLIKKMELYGVIDDCTYFMGGGASFLIGSGSVQALRQIEKQEETKPDRVEQATTFFRSHPVWGYVALALIALTFIFTLLNQGLQLWDRMSGSSRAVSLPSNEKMPPADD